MKQIVNVRFRALKDGRKSIYLEYNHDSEKERVFLKLYLLQGRSAAAKAANKETMRVVEAIRAKITFFNSNKLISPIFLINYINFFIKILLVQKLFIFLHR